MLKRIAWVTFADMTRHADGTLHSTIASARYRVLIPISQLNPLHWHSDVLVLQQGQTVSADMQHALENVDIAVFSKGIEAVNETLARQVQARGGKVIFDVCDPHFGHPQLGSYYKAMAKLADQVTCNTPVMAELVSAYTSAPCRVIDDPVEGARLPARFAPEERLKLLWFGSPLNLDSLTAALPALLNAATRKKLHLTIVTQLTPELARYCARAAHETGGALHMAAVQWSPEAQQQALEEADAVIIPAPAQEIKSTKSANRMVESLQAGRAVIAGPLPAYQPFAGWAYVGPDMEQGITWLLRERGRIPALIEQAQQFIHEHYAPEIIGRQWDAALKDLL